MTFPASNRFELKFVIPLDKAFEIFDAFKAYCVKDDHSNEDWEYSVSSIYYDSKSFIFYNDREESVGYRRKIRFRTYSLDEQSVHSSFLEIKEKHKNQVAKKRAKFADSSFLNCITNLNTVPLARLLSELPDSAVKREIAYLDEKLSLFPTPIIRYKRKIAIGRFDPSLRITVDYNLLSGGGDSLLTHDSSTGKSVLSPFKAVFEIKTRNTLPLWLQQVVSKYGFFRVKYSKYCESLKSSDLVIAKVPFHSTTKNSHENLIQSLASNDAREYQLKSNSSYSAAV
jgi:hypothetical protein